MMQFLMLELDFQKKVQSIKNLQNLNIHDSRYILSYCLIRVYWYEASRETKGHLLHDDSSHPHHPYHENGKISCYEGAVMDLELLIPLNKFVKSNGIYESR